MQLDDSALLEVRDLKVHFPIRQGVLQRQVGAVRAVDGVGLPAAKRSALSAKAAAASRPPAWRSWV